ncbi:MAG: SDR family oxidoreductase [Spirochaetes bacterium]|nr:SDR family oxidoreductase [Spirochaetota bacterium]
MNTLKNKKAIVTGGASGIGKAISEELAKLGADIIIHYHTSKKEADELINKIKNNYNKIYKIQADLTKMEEIKKVIDFTKEKFGHLDILINNTGDMVKRINLEDMSPDFINKVFEINYNTMILLTREALSLLKLNKEGASIVNLSSLAGKNGGGKGALIYSSTKGAILTATKGLANDLACYGIRVNCVAPGLILGSKFHQIHTSEESKVKTIKSIPLQRAGTCDDVARVVAFLASEYNGFITGASIDINGGVYS